MSEMTRRDLIAKASLAAGTSIIPAGLLGFELQQGSLPKPPGMTYRTPREPIKAIILGFGGRGSYYGAISEGISSELKIVGVAEPIDYRRNNAASRHGIPASQQAVTWEHIFDKPRFADLVIISTPDHLHYGPAMAALSKGYHLLLEKPIAQSWKQCEDILKLATKMHAIVGVCHVLRYAPYFVQLKEVIRSGMIGDVVSMQHLEPIYYLHFAHSYVRGNWHETKKSNPTILSKSCHDLDLLRWWAGVSCERVSSFGSLKFFSEEYAPKGAPEFCHQGCPVEKTCVYNAADVYVHKKLWGNSTIISDDRSDGAILKALQQCDYGRCVYRNDNDVVDHQSVIMQFANKVTASFNMEAMTSYGGRRTRVTGTKGDIVGDERYLDVYDFENRKGIRWDVNQNAQDLGGHGGGDPRMVRDLVQAIIRNDPTLLTSNLADSMESHLIGFKAEESRKKGGQVIKTTMPKL